MQSHQNEEKEVKLQLESFLHEVLNSPLSAQAKEEARKNIATLIYIFDHLSLIGEAVDDWVKHKTTDRTKANDKFYTSFKIKEKNDLDKKKGVLRTSEGASFHIGYYADSKAAIEGLSNHVKQFALVVNNLKGDDRLLFAKRLQWNKVVGCNEERTERPLLWAAGRQAQPKVALRYTMGSIFSVATVNDELCIAHQAAKKIRDEAEVAEQIRRAEEQRCADIATFAHRLKTYKEPPATDWIDSFAKIFGPTSSNFESAARKMAQLLEREQVEFTSDELLALKSRQLGEIILELRQKNILPQDYIRQEDRLTIARTSYSRC